MTRLACSLVLALATGAPAPTSAVQAGPELAAGLRHINEGRYDAAVATLGAAVHSITSGGFDATRDELAEANLCLGVAYVGLGEIEMGKARLRLALDLAPDLRLDLERFSPLAAPVAEATVRLLKEAWREGRLREAEPAPPRRSETSGLPRPALPPLARTVVQADEAEAEHGPRPPGLEIMAGLGYHAPTRTYANGETSNVDWSGAAAVLDAAVNLNEVFSVAVGGSGPYHDGKYGLGTLMLRARLATGPVRMFLQGGAGLGGFFSTTLAVAIGAGIDIGLSERFRVRLLQVDAAWWEEGATPGRAASSGRLMRGSGGLVFVVGSLR